MVPVVVSLLWFIFAAASAATAAVDRLQHAKRGGQAGATHALPVRVREACERSEGPGIFGVSRP